MHSPHQIQCLQELGISFLQLKEGFTQSQSSNRSTPETQDKPISWNSVANAWLDDLRVVFPNLQVNDHLLQLNESLTWQLVDIEGVEINKNLIKTGTPITLTVKQMSEIWLFLLTQINND